MKIQMVSNRYWPVVGGAELQGAQMAAQFQQHGHEVRVVTRHILPDLAPIEDVNGITVRRLGPIGLSRMANVLIVFNLIYYLLRHARDVDVIHSQGVGPIGLASIISGILLRKPVVIRVATQGDLSRQTFTLERMTTYQYLMRRILLPPALWKIVLGRATAIVALSHEIMREGQQLGLSDKMVYIPNGVDLTHFYPIDLNTRNALRQALGLSPNSFLILTVARLVRRKRLDVLIDAMPSILQALPHAHLLIAGDSTQDADSVADELYTQVIEMGLQDSVSFLGNVANINEYLQVADTFAFSSEREGMPNAILEAMATRLPIVATKIGGVTDLLGNDTGWMLPVGDADGLADAIISIATNPTLGEQRAATAYQRVHDNFTIDHMIKRYLDLYTQLQ